MTSFVCFEGFFLLPVPFSLFPPGSFLFFFPPAWSCVLPPRRLSFSLGPPLPCPPGGGLAEEGEGAAGGEIGVGWAEGRPGSGGRGSGSDSDREEEEKDGEEGEEEEGEEEENGDAVELPTFSSSGEEEALAMPDAAAEDGGGAVDRVPSRMLDTDAMEAVMAEEAPGPPEPKKARLSGDGGGD